MTSVLVSAVSSNQSSPSDSCVSWMCDPHLVWSVWRVAGLVVWTYHAMPGHLIPAWELCFTSTQGEATGQWEHEVGLLSRARQDRLVYVPSVSCQDQVTLSGPGLIIYLVLVRMSHS